MKTYIIVAEQLGNIEPLLTQVSSKWGRLSSTTYCFESSEGIRDLYNRFNLTSGSNQQLHIFTAAVDDYVGFGLPEVVQYLNKNLT